MFDITKDKLACKLLLKLVEREVIVGNMNNSMYVIIKLFELIWSQVSLKLSTFCGVGTPRVWSYFRNQIILVRQVSTLPFSFSNLTIAKLYCLAPDFALSPLTKLEMYHSKKRKRSVLIQFGKSLGCKSVKRVLLVGPKWIFMRLLKELKSERSSLVGAPKVWFYGIIVCGVFFFLETHLSIKHSRRILIYNRRNIYFFNMLYFEA